MVKPEVFVTFVNKKFDAEGKLTDADTEKHVRDFLESFAKWTKAMERATESNLI